MATDAADNSSFERQRIGRRLFAGSVVAVLLSVAVAAAILAHFHRDYRQAQQNAQLLHEFRRVLDAANRVSYERAPANKFMTAPAAALPRASAEWLAQQRLTDAALDAVVLRDMPVALMRDARAQLADARADVAAAQGSRDFGKLQDAIDAMFGAYDAYHTVMQRKASQLVEHDADLAGPALRAIELSNAREDAGRLGSELIVPIALGLPIPAANRRQVTRLQLRLEILHSMLAIDDGYIAGDRNAEWLRDEVNTRFFAIGQRPEPSGMDLIAQLADEGAQGGPYSLSTQQFTDRYVQLMAPLTEWRDAYLNWLVQHYHTVEKHALRMLVTVLVVATLLVLLIAYVTYRIYVRLMLPLLGASDDIVALAAEQLPAERARPRRRAKELQPLFAAIDVVGVRMRERAGLLQQLRRQAETDGLTQLLNRRTFETLGQAWLRERTHEVFMLMLDIDHFKRVNDTWGHPAGDAALVAVANALRENVRPDDLVGRIGGEEFAVLLHAPDLADASALAARLQDALRELRVDLGAGHVLRVTASFGLAGGRECDWKTLVADADAALYAAKQGGRDRIEVAR